MTTFKAIYNASSGFILEDDSGFKIHLTIGDRQHGGCCGSAIDVFKEEEKQVTQNEKLPQLEAFVGREFTRTRTLDAAADEHELTFDNGDTIRLGRDHKEPANVFVRVTINHVFNKMDRTRFQHCLLYTSPSPRD